MTASREAQIAREIEHTATGKADALQQTLDNMAAGKIDALPVADRLIARFYAGFRERLEIVVNHKARGPGAALRGWLRAVPLDTLTVLSLRTILRIGAGSGLPKGATHPTIQQFCIQLGRDIVMEAMVQRAYEVNAGYVNTTWRNIHKVGTVSESHIRRTMQAVVRNVLDADAELHLSQTEYLSIGKHVIQVAFDLDMLQRVAGRASTNFVILNPAITDVMLKGIYVAPGAPAMCCEPLPWAGVFDGGYLTAEMRLHYPLVTATRLRPQFRGAFRRAMSQAGSVTACASFLQGHSFTLHQPTLAVLKRLWEAGGGVLGVPKKTFRPKPVCPVEFGEASELSDEDEAAFTAWKAQARQWYTEQRKHNSSVIECAGLIKACNDGEMYFPTYVDWRGRYYYRGQPNPQGGDIAKGVLHFTEKRPLGDRGLYWLKVHIANCFGFDKASFDKRAEWTDLRLSALREGLGAPEDSDLYRGADSPFCAIAASVELFAAIDSGCPATYCTGIPIHMDATCSGLQHFSALLRDPVGGKFTNLIPTDTGEKEDIYTHVANLATRRIQRDAASSDPRIAAFAAEWLRLTIPRALAKGPVMTFAYGATVRGVSEDISDYLTDWSAQELADQLGEQPRVVRGAFCAYLAKALFGAVEDTVPAVAACMRWLKERVKQAPRDQPLKWVSPVGMPVWQEYRDFEEVRVPIRSCGFEKVVVGESLDTNKLSRMTNGISPNFVHSLDSAHLTRVALEMQRSGHSLVTIHDSFGTHPSSVDLMHTVIRSEFVKMYTDTPVLENFMEHIGQDVSLPPVGTLRLDQVESSEFFFC